MRRHLDQRSATSLGLVGRAHRWLLAAAVLVLLAPMLLATAAGASPSTAGSVVNTFVSGMPSVVSSSPFSGIGPFGLVFDSTGHLVASDAQNLGFYSFGPTGSTTPTPLSTGNAQTGLTFTRNGDLFSALYQAGNIDQIDPTTGAFIRQLNPPGTSFPCITGLATDPVDGDLVFGQPNSGGVCPGSPGITRVENPTSAHPTFVTTEPVSGVDYVEFAFAPDGTLYAVQQGPTLACAVRLTPMDAPAPVTVTTLACFPNFEDEFIGIESITLSLRPRGAPTVIVAGMSGTITQIDQTSSTPTTTPIVTLDTRVDGLAVGPDGCLYATQSSGIDRITRPDGSCRLVASSVVPSIRLGPRHPLSRVVGGTVTIVAHLVNVRHLAGTPVTFTVQGANPALRTVRADHAGIATLTYRGRHTGTDTITADATADGADLVSTAATIDWLAAPRGRGSTLRW